MADFDRLADGRRLHSPELAVRCEICGVLRHILHKHLRAAHGVDPRDYAGPLVSDNVRAIRRDQWLDQYGYNDPATGELRVRQWTTERAISHLQGFERRHGRPPTGTDLMRVTRHGVGRLGPPEATLPSHTVCEILFGGVAAALAAAGFEPRAHRVQRYKMRCACGEGFAAATPTAKFCSRRCAQRARYGKDPARYRAATARHTTQTRTPCVCARCDQPFLGTPGQRYCSRTCSARAVRHLGIAARLAKPCTGCGCELDDRTPGCKHCINRHSYRRRHSQAAA